MNLSSAFHRLELLSITIGGLFLINNNNAAIVVRAACQEGNEPFKDRDELKIAIDTCFEGDDPATAATIAEYNPEKCDEVVKVKYGWPMNTWCTGEVDNMELLFVGKRDFNEDISEWNTSKVTNLYETFSYAASFTGDISKWDVSNVWKMFGLFNGAKSSTVTFQAGTHHLLLT